MTKKRHWLVIFLLSTLVGFFLFTYFCWTPDSLTELAPADAVFYLHLNLNPFTRQGRNNLAWLEQYWQPAGQLQEKFSWAGPGPSLCQEMALIGLWHDHQLATALLFRPKKGDFSWGENQNQLTKLDSAGVISSTPYLVQQIREKDHPLSIGRQLGRGTGINGYLDLGRLNDYLTEQLGYSLLAPSEQEAGKGENRVEILLRPQREKLLLTIPLSFQMNSSINLSRDRIIDLLPWSGEKMILFGKSSDHFNLEQLEQRYKLNLAYQRPEEKKIILPDGSYFQELLADPQGFSFEEKEKVHLLTDESTGFRIGLLAEREMIGISDDPVFLQEVFPTLLQENNFFPDLTGGEFLFYWQGQKTGIKELFLIERADKIEGYLAI